MLSEDYLIKMQPVRARNLADLERCVGPVNDHISSLLESKQKPRILEIGYGFGTVLVQLLRLFRNSIELHGLSKDPREGSWEVACWNARQLGIATAQELATMPPPILHFGDANQRLPFPDCSFDFIFSQVSFYLLREKAHFLEELNRIMDFGGAAKIDIRALILKDVPEQYASLLEIWEKGKARSFVEYCEQIPSIAIKRAKCCLELQKRENFRLGLKLVDSIDLNLIHQRWYGVKSVYKLVEASS